MTFFIRLENNQPVGNPIVEDNFRQLFPNTSFSRFFIAEQVEPLGYGIYDFANQPAAEWNQKVTEITPVRNEHGIWKQTWQVTDLTGDELAAAKTQRDFNQSKNVRAERDTKLRQTDWTQLADSTADKAVWATYRQALRDVPAQAGFPWTVVWPTQP